MSIESTENMSAEYVPEAQADFDPDLQEKAAIADLAQVWAGARSHAIDCEGRVERQQAVHQTLREAGGPSHFAHADLLRVEAKWLAAKVAFLDAEEALSKCIRERRNRLYREEWDAKLALAAPEVADPSPDVMSDPYR